MNRENPHTAMVSEELTKFIFLVSFSFYAFFHSFSQPDLPNPPANLQTVTAGSLVIPMDNSLQNLRLGRPFNLKAYGLIHALLMQDIPVKWVIKSGKAKDAIDFSASAQRLYPTALAPAAVDFRASAFIIDTAYINNPAHSWTQSATQVITSYGNQVAVYQLMNNETVDVRYTLNQRPKIAVFNNGGNQILHKKILDSAGVTNYVAISAGVFTGLAECYTFCSEAHWASTVSDTAIMSKPVEFVYSGGNFFAQCHAVQTGTDGYEANMKIQTTNGFTEIGIGTASNTYYNPDLAIMQFHGLMKANQGGSGKNWRLAPGSSYRNGFYYAVSTANALDTVVVTGAKLTLPADTVGGNVFYLGGHDYFAAGADWNDILQINAGRIYLNATLIPAARPTAFVVDVGSNQTICAGQSVTLGGSPTAPAGTTFTWTPSTGLDNPNSANPVATPTSTTTYTVFADNNGCPGAGSVTVTVDPVPTTSVAGSDQTLCNTTTATLSGNTPSVGSGSWSVVSGTATITTPSSPTSTVTGLVVGDTVTLRWTISNSVCASSTDDVTIIVNSPPTTANAGNDQTICGVTSATLSANTPTVGTGVWSIVSGSATITNPNSASTTVTGLSAGNSYTFRWTISNGVCPPSTDDVTINVDLLPTTSNAGTDQTLCNTTTATLSGNTPSVGSGSWSVVSGTATITSPTSPTSSVTGLVIGDSVKLQWTISQGVCTSSDIVTITVNQLPTTANAGTDQTLCNTTTATLSGNSPTVGTGLWSVVSGTATITTPTSPTSTVTGLVVGSSATFQWTISNGVCSSSSDTVIITINSLPTTAAAGSDQTICNSSATLSANSPTSGTGLWNVVSGTATITSPSLPNSTVTGLVAGSSATLQWTISNGVCASSSDTVIISVDSPPTTANAGTDQTVCGVTSATLSANTPTVGTGVWSIVSGSATITNPNSASTTVTGLSAGNSYTFRWTISNGVCPPSTDDVTINVDLLPTTSNAGTDQTLCNTTTATLSGNTPSVGSGSWSVVSGTATITSPTSPTSSVTGLVIGDSVKLQWTISQGVCTSSDIVTITVNQLPTTANAGTDQTLCNTTTATLSGNSPTVGTGLWSVVSGTATITTPTSPTSTVTGLVVGSNATFQWTISNGVCSSSSDTVIITINSLPTTAAAGSDQTICNSSATLSANSPTSGTGLWNVVSGTATITSPSLPNSTVTGLVAGSSATLQWTISNGVCASSSDTVIISVDSPPTTANAGTDQTVCGVTSATLSANTPTVGTGVWSIVSGSATITNPNSVSTTVTGLSAGNSYTFRWTISNGVCPSSTDDITINVDLLPTTSNAGTDQTICNTSTATLSGNSPSVGTGLWSVVSGTATITSPASTNSTVTGLVPGDTAIFQWTITQGFCSNSDTVKIFVDDFSAVSIANTNVSCFGGNDGTATATPTNGISPYTFQWSNSQTNSTATGLSTGTYFLTATDANFCTATDSVTITEPATAVSVSISSTNVNCFGGNDGSASAAASGGTPNYSYQWDANANSQITATATGLIAGNYNVTATDNNGCTISISVNIDEPDSALNATTSSDSVSCKGGNNGSATATANGGTPPYNYLWNTNDTTSSIFNLQSAIYNFTVTDFNNCTFTASVNVGEPATLLSLDTSSTLVICNGDDNGTATVIPTGGVSPYFYLWDANANSQTTSTATGLIAGTYSVTVTDNNNCIMDTIVFVDQPFSPLSIAVATDSVKCFGENDGSAIVTPSGGTSPYTYEWDDANSQTDSIATGLSAGTYSVTVTDNTQNCKVGNFIIVSQPDSIILNPTFSNVSCFGGNDGTAAVAAAGGTSPYTYQWNNLTIQQFNNNLSSGNYSVTVTDNNGCSDSANFNITEPASPLQISSLNFTNVNCNGGSDGTASVTVSGGTSPYSFLWSDQNSTITSNVSGLIAGTYNITVKDTNNCSVDTFVTITEPFPGLIVSISETDVSCFGGNDGTATVTPSGGTSPYFYLWNDSNAQTDSTATGLSTGTYSVTITDSNGCVLDTNSSVFVGQPADSISVPNSHTNVSCNGGNDGSAMVNPFGGTSPYTFLWNDANAQTDSVATGLNAGTYNVTITDANGCVSDTNAVLITEPLPLTVGLSSTDVICKGDSNGTATVTPAGGTAPYFYQWDTNANSQTDSIAYGLKAGNYTVTVTDSNGCVNSNSFFIINEPSDSLSANLTFSDVICFGDSNGTAAVTPSGGWSPYVFQWSANAGSQTDSMVGGLKAGTYFVTISDSKGCADSSITVVISQPLQIVAIGSSGDTICPGAEAVISANGSGGTGNYSYSWNIGSGQTHVVNPSTNTSYFVTVTDDNGCISAADTVMVFVRNLYFDSLNVSCAAPNCTICPGDSTIISGYYKEEFPPYSYLWNNGLGSGLGPFTVRPAVTTVYVITVTDLCGNQITDSLTLYLEPFPVIDVLSPGPGCKPYSVSFENSAQNPAGSTYLWKFGDGKTSTQESPNHTYTNEGTFTVSLKITTPSPPGCILSVDTATTVTVNPVPQPNCAASPATATLKNPQINFSTGSFSSWFWDFGDGDTSTAQNPLHSYRDSGDFTIMVTVANEFGCQNTCEVQVRINPFYPLGIPNAFTPNPNGPNGGFYSFDDFSNNVFFPITRYVTDFRMEIYNRWGELLFVSEDIKTGWDGYYRNQLCQQDVYVWKIYLRWWDGNDWSGAGDVTLLR